MIQLLLGGLILFTLIRVIWFWEDTKLFLGAITVLCIFLVTSYWLGEAVIRLSLDLLK